MGNNQYIAFQLGNDAYATSILNVQEIINRMDTVRLPEAPEYIIGVIDFRDRVIPIIDLKKKLSLPEDPPTGSEKIIILNLNNLVLGGLVDQINGVISIDELSIKRELSAFNEEIREYISGFVNYENRIYKLIDFSCILSQRDLNYLTSRNTSTDNISNLPHLCENYFHKQITDNLTQKIKSDDDMAEMMEVVSFIQQFIDAISEGQLDRAEETLREITHLGQKRSAEEIERITSSLEKSLSEFKKLIDPEMQNIISEEMPQAKDKLQWVISKTEDAVSQTIKLVERNLNKQSDIVRQLDVIDNALKRVSDLTDEEKKAMEQLRFTLEETNADLMELLLIQEYQDLTGQIIKKVIGLTSTLERELKRLVELFGKRQETKKEEKVNHQDDVDELLKEFGL